MEEEHNKVQDQFRIFNNSMLCMGSKDSSSKKVKEKKIRGKGDLFFEDQMLTFMGENKRLLNLHE